MATVRIEKVVFGEDYRLDILLSNGHRIIYNLEPKLYTARFHDISDRKLYRNGKIMEGKAVRWNASTELSLGEILLNVNSADR